MPATYLVLAVMDVAPRSHASVQQKNYMMVYHILGSWFSQPEPVYRG
jgi:hypothetical protein